MSRGSKEADNSGVAEWSPEAEMAAFRSIPVIDTEEAKTLLPELVQLCEMLGKTQSLDWNGVCAGMASVSGQLSPRDLLELCPSIEIPGSLWTALLHPGSVNTSGILKVLARAVEEVYDRLHKEEVKEALRAHKIECDRIKTEESVAGRDPDQARLPGFKPPLRRKGLAGGGSLAAAGFTAAQTQNRDAMTAVEPELDGILGWLLAEFAFDSAVPAKLWDGTTWDRPVMKQSTEFVRESGKTKSHHLEHKKENPLDFWVACNPQNHCAYFRTCAKTPDAILCPLRFLPGGTAYGLHRAHKHTHSLIRFMAHGSRFMAHGQRRRTIFSRLSRACRGQMRSACGGHSSLSARAVTSMSC